MVVMHALKCKEHNIMQWEIPSFEESNKAPDFELIDEGTYTVQLVEIGEPTPVDPKYDATGKKTRAQFTFEVVDDPDYEGYKINQWYNITMNEKSALYPIAKALLGGTVDPSKPVSPGSLINQKGVAMIKHNDPNAKGQVWPRIDSMTALRKPRASKNATVQAAMETFDAVDDTMADVPF